MQTTTDATALATVRAAEAALEIARARRADAAIAVVAASGSFRIREAAEALVKADDILWEVESAYNAVLMDYYGEPGM